MATYRRILKAFWFSAVLTIMLSLAIVTTSVMANLPPPVFADTGGGMVASENVTDALPHDPEPAHPKITARANANDDTVIESVTKKVKLDVPRGAVSGEVEIELTEHGQWGPTGSGMLNVIELNAYKVHWGTAMITNKISRFEQNLTLSITHTPGELAGLDVDTLKLCYLDEESGQWVPLDDSKYDYETRTLTATTDHFTKFGENIQPVIHGPGKVSAFVTDLQSGAAIATYPIEVPPGSGGFQPSISLNYSSSAVDEMKNRRSVGSWVGIGWSLSLGSISYDESSGAYSLDLGGRSYALLAGAETDEYVTAPESFYKITRSGTEWYQWDVYDREGTHYRFGGTADSSQYYRNEYGAMIYYRSDLSYMGDAGGANDITATYVQNICSDNNGLYVRSAYPSHVQYNDGHVDIQFNSSFSEIVEGVGWRFDNPRNPAPKVIENRKLDSIEIKVDDSLVRKYVFAYYTSNFEPSGHYGGIDYAGQHRLESITEYGANGSSTLPAMSFVYTTKRVFHYDDDEDLYDGNPGNPADELEWPYLFQTYNGYGATVTHYYTQMPAGSPVHTWTRQIVTTRIVDPGTGTPETYSYRYWNKSGAENQPEYYGIGPAQHGWDDRYRGFSKVRLTDAAGYYSDHYFHTTGTPDAEILTGKEYCTEWRSSSGQLLQKQDSTWSYRYVQDEPSSPGVAVGYWTFDEGSGQWALDSSGFNHHGTLGSGTYPEGCDPTWISGGRFGNALSFDGNDDYVKLPNLSSLNLDGAFTLSAWVRRTSPAYNGCVISWGLAGSGEYTHRFELRLGDELDPGRCGVIMDRADGSGEAAHVYGPRIQDQFWHYFVITYDGYTVCLYVDGRYGGGDEQNGVPVSGNSATDRRVGSLASPGNDCYLHGEVDDVRAYNGVKPEVVWMWKPSAPFVYLSQVTETTYNLNPGGSPKTSRVRYEYDDYGNVVKEYQDGDTSISTDDSVVERTYYPNTATNILSCVAIERVKDGSGNTKQETLYYYDGNNNSVTTPPTKGNLTRVEQKKGDGGSVSTYYAYDNWGNVLSETDPNGNTTWITYETNYHTFPQTVTLPIAGQVESYTFDARTGNPLAVTDVNGQTTTYEYDTFGRVTKVIKPGDSSLYPTVKYYYMDWGTLNRQRLKTRTKLTDGKYLWQSQFFDGFGRVIQTHSRGVDGHVIVDETSVYNSRGLLEKAYVSQELLPPPPLFEYYYQAPQSDWKHTSYVYDGLGRVTTTTAEDGTITSTDYSVPWQTTVTNPRGYKTTNYYDAFGKLTKVEELDASHGVYATTLYEYDTLGNLTKVTDDEGNVTSMSYDWLSRKTSLSDPDMGSRTYTYDSNGNLLTQTDARGQTITFSYDALNRLTGKTYPAGSGMTDVDYFYDSTSGGNCGKGHRTGMTDASGITSWKYDARGRIVEEKRTIDVGPTIDVGAGAIDRSDSEDEGGYTIIDLNNPANADGVLTSFSFWFNQAATGVRVGTFYLVSGSTCKCRDSGVIGNVAAGSKQTFTRDSVGNPLSLEVKAGDLIGWYFPTGRIECDRSGGAGQMYIYGEYIDSGDQASYALDDGMAMSVYAQGTTVSVDYVTGYSYDSSDRLVRVTYPTGEEVTQTWNDRGLPDTLNGTTVGNLVSSTLYNQLGEITRINLGNATYTAFAYYGLDNSYGYYGQPWQTKTTKITEGDIQNLTYTWDDNGNLTQRQDVVSGQTETFTYDFLDRLTGVSGAYSNSYTYDKIGNITSFNGNSYTYGTKPHAVTAVGSTTYTYDANGNMTARGSQTLTWDVENRLVGVSAAAGAPEEIDVGPGAKDRSGTDNENGYTLVDLNNPANADGVLTSFSFWFNQAATGVRVGTFYLVSGSTYKCRDSAVIGNVAAGSKQTFTQDSGGNPLSLEVKAGDFIGWYVTTGVMECDYSGGSGVKYILGEYIDAGDEAYYHTASGWSMSVYAQGTTVVMPAIDVGAGASLGDAYFTIGRLQIGLDVGVSFGFINDRQEGVWKVDLMPVDLLKIGWKYQ